MSTTTGQRTRPTTRASIKALNFSSMSKALADVMHKESRDSKESKESSGEKEKVKKTRDGAVTKRSSLVPPAVSAADKAATVKKDKAASPDTSTITKHSRRLSSLPKAGGGTSSEDQIPFPKPISPKRGSTRTSTLRPRSSLNPSALPKYRPRSALIETTKRDPSPPARAGTRRRLSVSSADTEGKGKGLVLDIPKSGEKNGRAISPLPHRNALQVNLTAAINVTPATPEKDPKIPKATSLRQPSPKRASTPPRSKGKAAPAPVSPVARPPSSASSSSSPGSAPSTPKRTIGRSTGSIRTGSSTAPSPLRRSVAAPPDSPSPRSSTRKNSHNATPSASRSRSQSGPQAPIVLTADSSIDSMDASDVEFMLQDVVSPSAPTPALPRFRTVDMSVEPSLHTPPRSSTSALPGRSNLSYLSPAAATGEGSPFLRPQRRGITNDRGSILSWEALAQHNKSMGTPDVEHMLRDIDAPYNLMASPTPSQLTLTDIPESPTLSAMPSPSGYGSISQVLLPDVTPLPAVRAASSRFDDSAPASPLESGTMNLLRLQLASVENTAQEQRSEIESLRAQLGAATEARLRDTEDLARQISALEEHIRGTLASKTEDRWAQYAASLEEQLAQAQVVRDAAVTDALKQAALDAVAAQTAVVRRQQAALDVAAAAGDARAAWRSVECTAESELEMVRSSREMLGVLLAGIDCSLQRCI